MKTWLFLLISILISFILYGTSIRGVFVYDDFNWTNRKELKDGSSLIKLWKEPYIPGLEENGTYRPFTIFSFALNFSLFGESTASFHIVNIILNGLVIFLVYELVKKLFGNEFLAIATALFFAFMPIHSDAVAFIKSRDELLRSVLILLSWMTFLKANALKHIVKWQYILISLILYFFAMLAKETIVIAPFQFFAVFFLLNEKKRSQIPKLAVFYIIVLIIYMYIRFLVLGNYAFGTDNLAYALNPIRLVPLLSRLWTACAIAFLYISKAFVPWNLSATYHSKYLEPYYNPWQSMAIPFGIIFLLILIFLILFKKTRRSPLGIGALFFLSSYAIISKFFFTAGEIMAERMLYYPSIGLAMMAGFVFLKIFQRKKLLGIALLTVVLFVYTAIVIPRNYIWLSKRNLGESMIRDAPKSFEGYFMMATVEFNGKNFEKAKEYAKNAYAIDKTFPSLLHLMGRLAIVESRYDLAERLLRKSLTRQTKVEITKYLAYAIAKQGRYEESQQLLLHNIKEYQDDKQAKTLLGINYLKLGQKDKAQEYLKWDEDTNQFEEQQILDNF
ncbi:glycosyltransferase family 39 protein [Candidatus Microgenomates bacterium]|nr:glycosyltransferase family 39 protein [Candidatus Microgenomates bacterium]